MKILDGREAGMTAGGETACSIFLKTPYEQEEAAHIEEDLGYVASALLNSQKAERARVGVSAYRDVRHVTLTTVIVEDFLERLSIL